MGFFNWDKVDLESDVGRQHFADAIDTFLQIPDRFCGDPKIHGALQHFTLTGDFPADVRDLAQKINEVEDIDTGWERVFEYREQPEGDGYDILTIGDTGFTFDELKPGDRTQIRTFSGSKVRVSFVDYQDAFGWSPMTWKRRQFVELEDGLKQMRAAGYNKKADVCYAIIEAASSAINIAYQGEDSDSDAVRLAKTINSAATTTITNLTNKGMDVANPSFVVLAPFALKTRIAPALSVTHQAYAGSDSVMQFGVEAVYSSRLSASDTFYVILPRRQLKARQQLPLTLRYGSDILQNLEYAAGIMSFGAGNGAEEQIKRCATAAA